MTSAYYDQVIVGAGISGLYLLHAPAGAAVALETGTVKASS
jgi:cation diffusion facilitator CzcD-associated flavoprotein CzcO